MTVLTEGSRALQALLTELPGEMSRRVVTIASGQDLPAQAVVGEVLSAGTPTFVGTVGARGAVTIGAAIGVDTKPGTYQLVCVAASANAGTFRLQAPAGSFVPFNTASGMLTVAGGATSSSHLTVTIADGADDFLVGDTYTVAVTAGNVKALAPAATNGTQIATGILYDDYNATAAAVEGVLFDRECAFNADEVVWPAGITAAQKNTAIAQLANKQIELRANT